MLHSGAESDPFDLPELCLYGMITFSSLLVAYIAVFFAYQVDLWARVLEAWRGVLGQPPGGEEHILHTLPYYLAVTRSSCEVSKRQHLLKQARKSSEDAQAGYAQFEKFGLGNL